MPSDLELILESLGTNWFCPRAANKGCNILEKHFLPISQAKKFFSFFLLEIQRAQWKELGKEENISFLSTLGILSAALRWCQRKSQTKANVLLLRKPAFLGIL